MGPEEMRTIIEDIFLEQQLWTLLWVLISVLGFATVSFFGEYLKRRAENYAMKQDFETLKTQLQQNTEIVEQTKVEVQNRQWLQKLNQELQKTRGVERQELRYESYGTLWSKLKPLAIYHGEIFDKKAASDLSSELTNWYFSQKGGLLLTSQTREFYFALQDLLRITGDLRENWETSSSGKSAGGQKQTFKEVLLESEKRKNDSAEPGKSPEKAVNVLNYFTEVDFTDWQMEAPAKGKIWRKGINDVAGHWIDLDEEQRFATLQQVGSILRTSLTNDLESRLR